MKMRGHRRQRAEAPSVPSTIRLSPDERALAERAARANRQSLSDFMRDALLSAAGDCLELPASMHTVVLHLQSSHS